ncbi:hypothetical protein DFH09DRAFT_213311 [Mycena vulgaris]|nr:hypothetical protein DFH09DRAFT_213311 [Mycena vulgaris]
MPAFAAPLIFTAHVHAASIARTSLQRQLIFIRASDFVACAAQTMEISGYTESHQRTFVAIDQRKRYARSGMAPGPSRTRYPTHTTPSNNRYGPVIVVSSR